MPTSTGLAVYRWCDMSKPFLRRYLRAARKDLRTQLYAASPSLALISEVNSACKASSGRQGNATKPAWLIGPI